MQVLVNGQIFDSEKTPMVLKLTEREKALIRDMPEDNKKMASCPDNYSADDMQKLLDDMNNQFEQGE